MGAVAIGYFFATAFAMAVACCGPDPRAKLCSAYLLCSWMISNRIFQTNTPPETMEDFFFLDVASSLVIYLVMLLWPSRWLALLLAALSAQVLMEAYYEIIAPEHRNDYGSFLVNNLLFALQLIAVTLPTVRHFRPRRPPAPRAPPRKIPPPYEGWLPPSERYAMPASEPWRPEPDERI